MRKIPGTMISQHPDHGSKPYWQKSAFIKTGDEIKESFLSFSELGTSEYKWDWEGKYVDESVIEKLLSEYHDYFRKNPLGKENFLTFRLPNPKVETEFRLGRAFMGILGAAGLARKIGFHSPPLFEVILPMTESAEEMIAIQEAFKEIASLKHALYDFGENSLKHIEIVPLFEQVTTIIKSDSILKKYLKLHQKKFHFKPLYLRPYLARSDPALNSGLVPTVLAIKISLSHYIKFEKKHNIKLYPIIGSASLPFRGGLTPNTVEQFCREYKGIKTVLIQSAFRYDYEKKSVIKAIKKLEKILPTNKAISITIAEEKEIVKIITIFEKYYRNTVEQLAPLINKVAFYLPKRRERVLHIGLFGYSRGVGKVKLPRAIGFTGALYSLGIPPEIMGTGRGIRYAIKTGKIRLLEKYYLNIKEDLRRAGRFVQKDELIKMAKNSQVWKDILEDILEIEKYLREKLEPKTKEEKEHFELVKKLHEKINSEKKYHQYLNRLAILRKSLG
ncbi:MAG: phosphoenolpyruvate carboxylase [Patescibacteria group bacterium]